MPASDFDTEHEKGRNLSFEQAHELAASQLVEARAMDAASPGEHRFFQTIRFNWVLAASLVSALLLAVIIFIVWFWRAS